MFSIPIEADKKVLPDLHPDTIVLPFWLMMLVRVRVSNDIGTSPCQYDCVGTATYLL